MQKGTCCLLQQSMHVQCIAPAAADQDAATDVVAACRMQWRSRQYTPKPRGGGGPRGRGGLAARGGRGGGRGGFAGARPSAASGSEDDEDRPRWRRDGNDEDDEPARRDASRGKAPGCTGNQKALCQCRAALLTPVFHGGQVTPSNPSSRVWQALTDVRG